MKGSLTKFDITHQRLEIDMKASNDPQDKRMYTVDYEIKPSNQAVVIGSVKLMLNRYDTQGENLIQQEHQVLFKTIEDKIEEWIYG